MEDIPVEIAVKFMIFLTYDNIMKIILNFPHWKEFTRINLWKERYEVGKDSKINNLMSPYFPGDYITSLIFLKGIKPNNFQEECNNYLSHACINGDSTIVKLCLYLVFNVNRKRQSESIVKSLKHDHKEASILILRDDRFVAHVRYLNEIMTTAIDMNQVEIIRLILSLKKFKIPRKSKVFLLACELWRPEIILLFLNDGRINPSLKNNKSLIRACMKGRDDIVRLLCEDSRIYNNIKYNFIDNFKHLCVLLTTSVIPRYYKGKTLNMLMNTRIITQDGILYISEKCPEPIVISLILEYGIERLTICSCDFLLKQSIKYGRFNLLDFLLKYGNISEQYRQNALELL